jgi:hypothetical protein
MKSHTTFCWLCWILVLPLLASLILAARANAAESETLPEGLKVVSLEVRPTAVELKHRFDNRQLLVIGKLDTGEVVDLTRIAKQQLTGEAAIVTPEGNVRAAKDGAAELVFTHESHSVKVPIQVSGIAEPRVVSFVQDVQPALSKMGCNAGTCHGSKDGKNGFKLSLRGYDPLYDHRALTDDIGARRFNRAAPDQSLFLLKSTGATPHVGGVRVNVGEPYYELLREWIVQGAKLDLDQPRVARIEIYPTDTIIARPGMKQQIVVTAHFTDGASRDVTREAFIESGDIEVLEAGASGVVTTLRRGEASVLVRYEGAYAATTLIVMGDRSGFAWKETPTHNYIDELVYKKLQRVKILPSELCSDDEFIRRVYIDLTGLPPSSEEVREFLADQRDTQAKRAALVDRLVGSRAYVEHWTNKWADMLQVNRKFLGEEGSIVLRNWIQDSVASNKPYDQFAREVLTAGGSNLENPPAAYYKVLREPDALMENTTHLFLAVRFNCNKCHDHPFERWTQDQYYQMAAYFAQIGRKPDQNFAGQTIGGSAVEGATPLVEVIYDSGSGEVTHDRTGKQTPPAFPYQQELVGELNGSRRKLLAEWITAKDNQYFAKSYVNRLWGYLFGIGIIDPIDDIRAGNPPSNPELLDALTRDFIDSGFDAQHMLRQICKSRVYQHSVVSNDWNHDDTLNYSHAVPRRLTAETLFDAIHVATGSTPRISGAPAGFRAAQLPDAGVSDPFLDDFGRPVRESACECERSTGMVLGPIMKLVNGPTVANAIADPGNALAKLVASEADDRRVIEEVFLRFLARKPMESEVQLGLEAINAVGEGHERLVEALAEYEKTLPERQAAWEKTAGGPVEWKSLELGEMKSSAGATFTKQDDGSVLVGGPLAKDVYTITASTDLSGITGIKLEALPDDSLSAKGPGRAKNGNFVLNELKLAIAPKADPSQSEPAALQNAAADFSQDSWAAAGAIDGNESTGWAIMPQFGKAHELIAELKAPAGAEGGSVLTLSMSHQFPDGAHNVGRFRLSVTTSPTPASGSKLPEAVLAALAIPAAERSEEQQQLLAAHYRSIDGELARLAAEVKQSETQLANKRLIGVQDLAWALINSPAFLFNR